MISKTYQQIYAAVRKIPSGKVATYGQIATMAGFDGQPRLVGYALHASPPGSGIPWHRIINASGKISLAGPNARKQRKLLEAEGVEFSQAGRVNLSKFRFV